MPELASSAILEGLTAALDRNTAALLTVAAEIGKASGRSAESIQEWLLTDVQKNHQNLLRQLTRR